MTDTDPGSSIPMIATIAPGMPRRLSPTITDMLTAIRPGTVSLISIAPRNPSSSSHPCSLTIYSRR